MCSQCPRNVNTSRNYTRSGTNCPLFVAKVYYIRDRITRFCKLFVVSALGTRALKRARTPVGELGHNVRKSVQVALYYVHKSVKVALYNVQYTLQFALYL